MTTYYSGSGTDTTTVTGPGTLTLQVLGAGGSGGTGHTTLSGAGPTPGGGGGAGGFSEKTYTVTGPTTIDWVVGTGGAAVTDPVSNTGYPGVRGGDSTVAIGGTLLLIGQGGNGGVSGDETHPGTGDSAGGTASGGFVNYTGDNGVGYGLSWTYPDNNGGNGGRAPSDFGSGTGAPGGAGGIFNTTPGVNGTGYGAGGGGGAAGFSNNSYFSGAGINGFVNIIFTPDTGGTSGTTTYRFIPLYAHGYDVSALATPLYTNAIGLQESPLTLFLHGSGYFPLFPFLLYTTNFEQQTGSFPMYCNGIYQSVAPLTLYTSTVLHAENNIPLYCYGKGVLTKSTSLYSYGIQGATKALSLFAKAPVPDVLTRGISISLQGSMYPGMTRGIPLYACVGKDAQTPSVHIPLFAKAVDQTTLTRLMNMFAAGCAHEAYRGIDLVAWNTQLGLSGQFPLFVQGDGVTENAMPFGKGINLVLRRDPANSISLYTQGPGELLSLNTSLFTLGGLADFASLDLSVPNIVGLPQLPVKLFTTGF